MRYSQEHALRALYVLRTHYGLRPQGMHCVHLWASLTRIHSGFQTSSMRFASLFANSRKK